MCRVKICQRGVLTARAPSTKGNSRSERIWPRTRRAYDGHQTAVSAISTVTSPGPSAAAIAMARIM